MKVDLIKRHFSDNTEDYSIVIGINKELTFHVYSIPDFVNFYTGKDEKEAFKTFDKFTVNCKGELKSFI